MLPLVRIDSNQASDSGRIRSVAASSTTAASSPAGTPGKADSDSDSDGVQLSHLSSVLNGLATGAASTLQRIATLTPLVRSGLYQVPAQMVASRMVADALGAG